MTYLQNQQFQTFLETLGNATRWGIWLAIMASIVTTLCYIGALTSSIHVIYISVMVAIWAQVYAGLELKLEMP